MEFKRTKFLGNQAEIFVAKQLESKGFSIIARNYWKPFGEIDIIAKNNNAILFVEVKMRTNIHFDLSCLITLTKQKKITAVAKEFIAHHQINNYECRFDVALVTYKNEIWSLEYIENAFTVYEPCS